MSNTEILRPSGTGFEWCINQYDGCSHGCKYCYGMTIRRKKYEDWMKVARARARMSEKPTSVKIIAAATLVATLLVTLILGGAEVWLLVILSQFSSEISINGEIYVLVALILQGYAFIISIAMLVSDSKYVWYASVAFWLSIIVADLSFTLPFFFIASYTVLAVLLFSPILSSIICLYFFLREKVKDYFHV